MSETLGRIEAAVSAIVRAHGADSLGAVLWEVAEKIRLGSAKRCGREGCPNLFFAKRGPNSVEFRRQEYCCNSCARIATVETRSASIREKRAHAPRDPGGRFAPVAAVDAPINAAAELARIRQLAEPPYRNGAGRA